MSSYSRRQLHINQMHIHDCCEDIAKGVHVLSIGLDAWVGVWGKFESRLHGSSKQDEVKGTVNGGRRAGFNNLASQLWKGKKEKKAQETG